MTTDTIDATLKMPRFNLPVAPQSETTLNMLHISSLASVPFSESDGQAARFRKEIVRDYENGDMAMYLDTGYGFELVGFARNYSEADVTLDELIFAIRYQDTPGTDCPSCGDLLCEDAAICTACRENGERTMIDTALSFDPSDGAPKDPQQPGEPPTKGGDGRIDPRATLTALLKASLEEWEALGIPTPYDVPLAHLARLLSPQGENVPPDWQCVDEEQRQIRTEAAGRGINWHFRQDRARFLRCVAQCGDSNRRAMAGALESYLTTQTRRIFTSAPISAERIIAFWASEQAHSDC